MPSYSKTGLINIGIAAFYALATYVSYVLVADRYGATLGSDAYFFLFSFTTLCTGLFTALFATTFMPLLIELRIRQGNDASNDFASVILTWVLLVAFSGLVTAAFFDEQILAGVSRFSSDQLASAGNLFRYFPLVVFFGVIAEYYRVAVMSFRHFTLSAAGSLFPPVLLVATLVALPGSEETMAVALVVAKALQMLFFWNIATRSGLGLRPRLTIGVETRRFAKVSLPYFSASFFTYASTFYFDYIATGLGAGVLTAVSYAQRLFVLPLVVAFNPLIEIARVHFAELHAQGDDQTLRKHYTRLLALIILFSLPIGLVFGLFPRELVDAIFRRGAFDAEAAAISAACLQIYALAIPLNCIFTLNGRIVESFQKLLWPSIFGSFGHLLFILATYQLSTSYGFLGIPLARTAVDLVYLFPFGFIAVYIFLGKTDFRPVLIVTISSIFFSSLLVLLYFTSISSARALGIFEPTQLFFAYMTVLSAAYVVMTWFLNRSLQGWLFGNAASFTLSRKKAPGAQTF